MQPDLPRLALLRHERRREDGEALRDPRRADRSPPEAYLKYAEDGRREHGDEIAADRRPQQAQLLRRPERVGRV